MSPTLTHDPDLSRVRISDAAPGYRDTFTRSVTDGWGSADTGETWTVSHPADHDVNGSAGTVALGSLDVARIATLGVSRTDVDIAVTVTPSVAATGDYIDAGIAGRYIDEATFYEARAEWKQSGVYGLGVYHGATWLDGIELGSYSAGQAFRLRLQVIGTRVRARMWPLTDPEPNTWHIALDDSSTTGAGDIAIRTNLRPNNTNTLPVTITVDDLLSRGTVAFQRSTDEIKWEQVRMEPVTKSAGDTIRASDYEFAPNVPNHYRVVSYDPPTGRVLFAGTSAQITPSLDAVWIKNLARPFLNRQVTVTDWGEIERPARQGVFSVIGRSYPLAVSDLHSSRRYELIVYTTSLSAADDLEFSLTTGDAVLLHVPDDCLVPRTMYAIIGDIAIERRSVRGVRRYFTLPLTEVAPPGPEIVGATITYQGIANSYASYETLLTGNISYEDVVDRIGTPEDVIVP